MNRSFRAETRSRAKDEVKQRFLQPVHRVRRWEKKWVVAGDATMRVYKWVPVSSDKPGARAKSLLSASACLSAGNKENVASVVAMATEEDSNTGFSVNSDLMDEDSRSVNFSDDSCSQSGPSSEKQ